MQRLMYSMGAFAALLVVGYAADPPATKTATPTKEAAPTKDVAKEPTEASAPQDTTGAINYWIKQGYEKAGIKKHAAAATDLEFMRRAFIDLIGRIPTTTEILDYEQDRSANKRAKLVRRLLYETKSSKGDTVNYTPKVGGRPVIAEVDNGEGKLVKRELSFDYPEEYAEHWANMWTVWLMSRTTHQTYRQQMQSWLANEFSKNTPHDELTRKLLTASGSTNKNSAVNFILHHLGDPNPRERQTELGLRDAVPITSRVTRLFLGLQTQCTQCHDHPFNKEWVQGDFWGVNAFFRQARRSADPTPRPGTGNNNRMMGFVQVELSDDTSLNPDTRVYYERRDGKLMASKPVMLKDYAQAEKGDPSGKRLPTDGSKNRREVLAQYVVSHDNYAKAYVNRIWGHLFGRGMSKEPTIDDFGSHNEVIHPELLERLASDFKKYNYDVKMLLEWICTSDVYNLSHVAVKEYADQKYDPYFARMPLKAMSPEVLYESLALATKAEGVQTKRDDNRRNRESWLDQLVRNFGDDEGNELTFNGTIVQALLMMNGKELNNQVTRKENNVVELIVKKNSRGGAVAVNAILDEIFLTAVGRHVTPAEIAAITDVQHGLILKDREAKPTTTPAPTPKTPPKKGPNKGPAPPSNVVMPSNVGDVKFYQDVFWALLNTTEFMLNH